MSENRMRKHATMFMPWAEGLPPDGPKSMACRLTRSHYAPALRKGWLAGEQKRGATLPPLNRAAEGGFTMPKFHHQRSTREAIPVPQHANPTAAAPARVPGHVPSLIVQRAMAAPRALRPAELMSLQRTLGNRATGAMLGSAAVQAKLIVSAPGDRYEREADRVADAVMRMPEAPSQIPAREHLPASMIPPTPTCSADDSLVVGEDFAGNLAASKGRGQPLPPSLQETFGAKFGADLRGVRVHSDAEAAPGDLYEREADRVAEAVMRRPAMRREGTPGRQDPPLVTTKPDLEHGGDGSFAASEEFARRLRASYGRGRPLPSSLRAEFGARFGVDLSGVTIHTDAEADGLSRSIAAEAFTQGRDIYFAGGHYAPNNVEGKRLLTHELTHVVQQNGRGNLKARPKQGEAFIGQVGHAFAIQRKPIKTSRLGHWWSPKTWKREAQNNPTIYTELKNAVSAYEKGEGSRQELESLQLIEVLANEWLAKHGASQKWTNEQKKAIIRELLSDVEAEVDKLSDEQQRQYLDRIVDTSYATLPNNKRRNKDPRFGKTDLKSNPNLFQYITLSSNEAMSLFSEEHEKASQKVREYKLTDEELAAIRVFTGGDYKYINPVLANDKEWLNKIINKLTEAGQLAKGNSGDKETMWGIRDVRDKLAPKGLDKSQLRDLKKEAMQHTRLAVAGLNKLPDAPHTTGYRGLRLTKAEIDKDYKKGDKVTWMNFNSTSTDPTIAENYAKKSTGDEKVGVLLIIEITKGKEIADISLVHGEKEVLLLPGATFTVTQAPVEREDGVVEVKLTQNMSTITTSTAGLMISPIPSATTSTSTTERTPYAWGAGGKTPLRSGPKLTEKPSLQRKGGYLDIIGGLKRGNVVRPDYPQAWETEWLLERGEILGKILKALLKWPGRLGEEYDFVEADLDQVLKELNRRVPL